MSKMSGLVLLLALSVVAPRSLAAQEQLTVERIGEFRAEAPPATRWLDDSTYTIVQRRPDGKGADLVAVNARDGRTTTLVNAETLLPAGAADALEIEGYQWSADRARLLVFTNSARVWRANTRGDYWALDLRTKQLRKLGADARPSSLMFAKFSPNGQRVAYVRENNLYVESLEDGRVTALTSDGSRTIINGTFDWVYEEELSLRDGYRWSPDGKSIAYWQLDASGVGEFLMINNTDSLYSFTIPVQYPKAGTTNSSARVGVVSSDGGPTTWISIPGDPRNNYLARMDWAANSTELIVQQLNRRQDQNTFWVATAASGAARTLFVERDSAWIDIYDDHTGWGPGPSLHWLPDGSAFVYLAERDGWRHAWMVARDGSMRLITKGEYDVMRIVSIDLKSGWLYFDASPGDATRMSLWRIRLKGGEPERLTPAGARGKHSYRVAPGARYAIHTASSWGSPPVTDLVELPSHRVLRTLVTNDRLKASLARVAQGDIEFFQTDIGDGVKLDSWMMKPPGFDPGRKYPILFHVYGEPWGQTVEDEYGGAGWLWHLMLTQQGYIVASVDNRGTPGPRGRAWRKAGLNRFGAIRVHDQSLAARAIIKRPYVDTSRVGVWGWSGGGSSTLHLMFRAPDIYKVGLSVAPVPDVKNYDTIYQERYLGLPGTDSAAYHDASAINYVKGLKGDLLVVHGTGDDNVHYQGTEQLVNALVAAGKQFSMMAYPNRSHGIYEGPGTTVHLYNLLTKYLADNLRSRLEVRP